MEHIIDPENFLGMSGTVMPLEDSEFFHEFNGFCIGVRRGFLQIKDQDDNVYEVEVRQFTPDDKECAEPPGLFGVWIDVETQKPKTGEKVIVCGHWDNGNRWRTVATWQPAGSIDASEWDDAPGHWWLKNGDACTNPTDDWIESPVGGERTYTLVNITHWMPLPNMPKNN